MKLKAVTKSPVVEGKSASLAHSFAVEDIVRLYSQQTGLNVQRFFDGMTEIGLYECSATGYRFYHPFAVQGDGEFYGSLYHANFDEGSGYDRDWSEDHEFALRHVSADDDVLEIGSGSGKFLERAGERARSARGLEIDEFAAGLATEKGLGVTVGSLETHAPSNEGRYSVVCAFQVLEHESDVRGFLNSAITLLRPGGRLLLSVPNSDPFYQRFNKYEVMNMPPHHVGLWRLVSLGRLTDFFEIELTGHEYFAHSRLLVDAYLRAKLWARVRSLPRRHGFSDKLKMLLLAPPAVLRSSIDYAAGNVNRGYLTVAFRKIN